MKNLKKYLLIPTLALVFTLSLAPSANVLAATSPTLAGASGYSVLGGATVTNTGGTTTTGAVGVSPGTAITGFPPGVAGGGTHSNDASAIAAQADNLAAFGTLDQTCDFTYGAQDLSLLSPLGPGVYCSTSSFSLSGNLTLAGSGVWIFKTVSTLITSSGSSVTGGDSCNVWWRVGSSATLATTTSFKGNVLALLDITMNTNATLDGRLLSQAAGAVSLDSNTITGPTCASTPSGGGGSSGSGSSGSSSGNGGSSGVVPGFPNAGFSPQGQSNPLWSLVIAGIAAASYSLYYVVRRQRAAS